MKIIRLPWTEKILFVRSMLNYCCIFFMKAFKKDLLNQYNHNIILGEFTCRIVHGLIFNFN